MRKFLAEFLILAQALPLFGGSTGVSYCFAKMNLCAEHCCQFAPSQTKAKSCCAGSIDGKSGEAGQAADGEDAPLRNAGHENHRCCEKLLPDNDFLPATRLPSAEPSVSIPENGLTETPFIFHRPCVNRQYRAHAPPRTVATASRLSLLQVYRL
jgi:hypothetical protein